MVRHRSDVPKFLALRLRVELDRDVIELSRFRIKLFDPILNSPLRNVVAQLIVRCLQVTSALNVGFSSLFP